MALPSSINNFTSVPIAIGLASARSRPNTFRRASSDEPFYLPTHRDNTIAPHSHSELQLSNLYDDMSSHTPHNNSDSLSTTTHGDGSSSLTRRHTFLNTENTHQHPAARNDDYNKKPGYYMHYSAMKQKVRQHSSYCNSDNILARRERQLDNMTERDMDEAYQHNIQPFSSSFKNILHYLRHDYLCNKFWWITLVKRSFPITTAVETYKQEYLFHDIAAGVAVGVSAIPIGMSYALLARFPPAHGLYCQFFYCLVYMIFGSGKQVCVGTSAIEAMMTADAVSSIIGWDASEEAWLNASIGLAFSVGIFLIAMRFCCLGIMANFLADPVVSGFSTGCAVIIAISQLNYFFGINVPRLDTSHTLGYIITHLHETHFCSILIGILSIILLYVFALINRKFLRRFPLPGSLFVMIIFILMGYLLKIDKPPYLVRIIGTVPKGLPSPKVFNFDTKIFPSLLRRGLWYSIVYFFIHSSISKTIAQKHGFMLDTNQELLATGMCTLIGSFFQCYPIATSVARTSIADGAGAATQLYNVTNFIAIGLTITALTPILYYLPMASLAAVILYGVYWMMSFDQAYRLLKLLSLDFVLWVICFLATVFWGAMEGIIISISFSLLWIIKQGAFPTTGILGRLPGTNVFRNIKTFPDAQEIPGCKILQFDASLNFSNADHFQKKIFQLIGLDLITKTPLQSKLSSFSDFRLSSVVAFAEHQSEDRNQYSNSHNNNNDNNHNREFCRESLEEHQLHADLTTRTTTSMEKINNDHKKKKRCSCCCFTTKHILDNNVKQITAISNSKNTFLDNPIKVVIIDASSINSLDVTAVRMLKNVAQCLKRHHMILLFCNWKGPMRQFLQRVEFYNVVPPDHCFLTINDAVLWAQVFYLNGAKKT